MNKLAVTIVLAFVFNQADANGFMGFGMGRGTIAPHDDSINMTQNDGYMVHGGYDFNDFVGVDFSLAHLAGTAAQNGINYNASTNIYSATVNGYLPVADSFRFEGKLGGSLVAGKAAAQNNAVGVLPGHAFGKRGLTWVVGGEYSINEYFGIALDYIHFTKNERLTAVTGTFHF